MLMWYYLIQSTLLTQFGMKVCFINYSSTKLTTSFSVFYVIIILVLSVLLRSGEFSHSGLILIKRFIKVGCFQTDYIRYSLTAY